MHSAKGLSAEVVFIPVAEDHAIPGFSKTREEELEERRLFFVAVTRAIEKVVFTTARLRTGNQCDFVTHHARRPKLTPFLRNSGLSHIRH